MVDYTHDFKLNWKKDKIEGECEFNVDGEASFNTEEPLPNVTVEQQRVITDLFKLLRRFFVEFGDIKKIKISKK